MAEAVPAPVGAEAAAALAPLHAAAFPPAERWGVDALRLMLEMPGAFALLCPEEGFIIARVAADEAEILTLAVAPEARRQGVARRLLRAASRQAAENGAGRLFLEVAVGNAAARGLYEGAGFTVAGLRRRYYADGGDALVLSRRLCEA